MDRDYTALFDEGVNRKGTHAIKWDGLGNLFGNPDAVPLWVADTDFAAPPEVVEALVNRAKHGAFGYSDHWNGDMEAARRWLQTRGGVEDAQTDWLLFCPGVVDALYVAILALTEKTDTVAIQPPVYGPFRMMVEKAGRNLYENRLIETADGWKMDLADMEKGLKQGVKMILLCSPHNPVGRVWTKKELADLAALANRYGATVVSDEIHGDIVYAGHKHTPMLAVPGGEKAVVAMAPSKTFNLAGHSHSLFAVRDAETREKIRAQLDSMGIGGGNVFGEIATEAAYTYGGAWLDALNRYLDGNRKEAEAFFAERMPEVRVTKSEGTFLMWLDFRAWGLKEEELKALLSKNGAALSTGTFFGAEYDGWMRLNFGTPRRILMEGLRNIEKAAKEIRGEKA